CDASQLQTIIHRQRIRFATAGLAYLLSGLLFWAMAISHERVAGSSCLVVVQPIAEKTPWRLHRRLPGRHATNHRVGVLYRRPHLDGAEMKLHLLRHTRLSIDSGICYGQTDVDIAPSFLDELQSIRAKLADMRFDSIYTSPLQRCHKLAE